MIERFAIAGYARISVDEELDRDNVSIENQKAIIEDFVKHRFPDSTLTFYEDRDRSGYTFEQREGYQEMRRGLMSHKYDILIVKDFSRFSRAIPAGWWNWRICGTPACVSSPSETTLTFQTTMTG